MEEADRLDDDQDGGWVNVSSGTGSLPPFPQIDII